MTNPTNLSPWIAVLLPGILAQQDEHLGQLIWPAMKDELASAGLAGASPIDAIIEWSRTELPRLASKATGAGAKVMALLNDRDTQHDAERLAIITAFLIDHFAQLHLELHVATAMAVLLVRHTTRNRPSTAHS